MSLNISTIYPGRVTAPTLDYPYGSSKNETSPGAGDGTPYELSRANDIFGLQQALLRAASITPSGSADTARVSEYLQSIVEIASGRAFNYDESGVTDVYVFDTQANQQGPRSYFDGMVVKAFCGNANTGVCTGDVNGLGVLDIKLPGGVDDPSAGAISATTESTFVYRSTPAAHLELQGRIGDYASGSHTFSAVAANTFTEITTIAHGLGSDNIDFGFKVTGSDVGGRNQISTLVSDANDYRVFMPANGSVFVPVSAISTPASGNLSIGVLTNSGTPTQDVTIDWWARRRV